MTSVPFCMYVRITNIEACHHHIALVKILGFHSKALRQVRLYNITNEIRAMTLIGYRPILQDLESDGQILCSLKKRIAVCHLLFN